MASKEIRVQRTGEIKARSSTSMKAPSRMRAAVGNGKTQSPSSEGTTGGHAMDICIIGGGVSGLSALQVIMGTPQYKSGLWKPTLFEARDKTGGVW